MYEPGALVEVPVEVMVALSVPTEASPLASEPLVTLNAVGDTDAP